MIRKIDTLALTLAALLAAPLTVFAQAVGMETTPPDATTTDRSMGDSDAQKKKNRRKKNRRRQTKEQVQSGKTQHDEHGKMKHSGSATDTGAEVRPAGGSAPTNAPAGGSNQGGEGTHQQGPASGTGY